MNLLVNLIINSFDIGVWDLFFDGWDISLRGWLLGELKEHILTPKVLLNSKSTLQKQCNQNLLFH